MPLLTRGAVEIFRHDWPLDSGRAADALGLHIHASGAGPSKRLPAGPTSRSGKPARDRFRAPKMHFRPNLTAGPNPRLSNRMPQTDTATVALAREAETAKRFGRSWSTTAGLSTGWRTG